MFWLQEQLSKAEEGRKFIIIQHVYAGARYKNHPMWNSYPNRVYFELLEKHKNKIIMEVGGHDHFTSMRYHTEKNIMDVDQSTSDTSLFHNILINPSVTPWYKHNPGISAIDINDETLIPFNYTASYLNLDATIGQTQRTPYSQLQWRDVDYNQLYGLDELTPQGIHKLRIRLQNNRELQ